MLTYPEIYSFYISFVDIVEMDSIYNKILQLFKMEKEKAFLGSLLHTYLPDG